MAARLLTTGPVLGLLAVASTVTAATDHGTHFVAALSGQGMDPPVESSGTGRFDGHWTVSMSWDPTANDTLAVIVDFQFLDGEPLELRVYAGQPAGQSPRTVLVADGGVQSGDEFRIPAADLDADSLASEMYWAALTTTAHADGEIAGRIEPLQRISACGYFHRETSICWTFVDYEENSVQWMIDDPVLGEAGQVWILAEYGGEWADCASPYHRWYYWLRILEVGACEREALGCGVFERDHYDGCHTWRSDSLGRFLIANIRSAADIDTVRLWGFPKVVNDVCLYGREVLVDSVAACRDTLSPVVRQSWGTLKERWSR